MRIAEIELDGAIALNDGRFSFADGALHVVTDPASGGYSVLVPVVPSAGYCGAATFRCDVDLLHGAVGASAATAELALIVERVATRRGRHVLEIIVPDVTNVMGILFRNALVTNRRSSVVISALTVDSCPAEKLIHVRRDRPTRRLKIPLRKHCHNDIGCTVAPEFIDTAAAAAIVIDAWETPEHPKTSARILSNIADKLVPALAAMRSSGAAVIHAPHDRLIHPLVRPLEGEVVIDGDIMDSDFISAVLRSAGIRRLFYMGYLSNVCVLTRSIGIIAMSKRGFDVTLVRDASVAVETAESISGEWFHKAAVHLVEQNYGTSISAAELQIAVG